MGFKTMKLSEAPPARPRGSISGKPLSPAGRMIRDGISSLVEPGDCVQFDTTELLGIGPMDPIPNDFKPDRVRAMVYSACKRLDISRGEYGSYFTEDLRAFVVFLKASGS